MYTLALVLIIHQILFQGMFLAKNILLAKKLKSSVRGKNREATIAIIHFTSFIILSFIVALFFPQLGYMPLLPQPIALIVGYIFLGSSLVVSAFALKTLKDSWRVGIKKNEKTKLITNGIYSLSRNPYFLSYIFLFLSYTILLQNLLLCVLSMVGVGLINNMIKKEEEHLLKQHSMLYKEYLKKVPRYLLFW